MITGRWIEPGHRLELEGLNADTKPTTWPDGGRQDADIPNGASLFCFDNPVSYWKYDAANHQWRELE